MVWNPRKAEWMASISPGSRSRISRLDSMLAIYSRDSTVKSTSRSTSPANENPELLGAATGPGAGGFGFTLAAAIGGCAGEGRAAGGSVSMLEAAAAFGLPAGAFREPRLDLAGECSSSVRMVLIPDAPAWVFRRRLEGGTALPHRTDSRGPAGCARRLWFSQC